MGKYLNLLSHRSCDCDQSDKSDQSPPLVASVASVASAKAFTEAFEALERRCPDYVPHERWHQAVEAGRRFLGRWGKQAQALGWSAADLFGLQTPPTNPRPTYSRLSRYDQTGLCWLLQGRRVVALTKDMAAIEGAGSITVYRRKAPPGAAIGTCIDLNCVSPPNGVSRLAYD